MGRQKNIQTKKALLHSKIRNNVIVVRPFSILGEYMPKTLAIGSFINQLFINKSKNLNTGRLDVYRDFLDVRDVIELTWKLMLIKNSYGKVINLCSGKPVMMREIVDFMIENSGLTVNIKENVVTQNLNNTDIIYGDNQLLHSIIGEFKFISWKNSMKRILKKYK